MNLMKGMFGEGNGKVKDEEAGDTEMDQSTAEKEQLLAREKVEWNDDGHEIKLEEDITKGFEQDNKVQVEVQTVATAAEASTESAMNADDAAFKRKMKNVSLVLCTFQNCVVIVALKYSRTNAARDSTGTLYITTTAVAMGELLKLIISICVILYEGGVKGLVRDVKAEMIEKPVECFKMVVPSLLYCVQNNLMFSAMAYISAATFQVTMQLKILTTAVFSVLLLGKVLQPYRWGGLAVLTTGCIFVNLDQAGTTSSAASPGGGSAMIGVAMTLTAACTSGLAGVYFEKLLKGAQTSLWIRQIQMALPGCVIGFSGCFLQDGDAIQKRGFFQGYTPFTVFLVVFSACGGLIVALVVKYADNLYKAFAVSLSIIMSTIISIPLFHFSISLLFFIGAVLVIMSIFLYEEMVRFDLRTNIFLSMVFVLAFMQIKL